MTFLKFTKTTLTATLLASMCHYSVGKNSTTLPAPDMASQAGFDSTCASLKKLPASAVKSLSKQHIQAWAICKDVALVQQTASWINQGFQRMNTRGKDGLDITNSFVLNLYIHTQLSYMQNELSGVRKVLKELKLDATDSLQLKPQTWVVDIDGDGQVSAWEKRFFALPNRSNDAEMTLGMPSDSDDVQLQTLIKTDQTDVLWALSYHQFIEGVVEMARAQSYNFSGSASGVKDMVVLKDKAAWSRAYGLIKDGFDTSQAMRSAAMSETDDDYEWIPNPKQKNSAFPLLLNYADYTTWGNTMDEIIQLWSGKTLLEPSKTARGILGESARLCPSGSGLEVPKLFGAQAPKSILDLSNYTAACTPLGPNRPGSQLLKMLEARSNDGDISNKMVRYLYWVN
jgi:hypothetical protein